ncbi:MAG TPA: GNAT family N-acetyltransferase [Bacteroidia bacterium]
MQDLNIEIARYSESRKSDWNGFIKKSKNSIFLFDRNYMDYHADRFHDHSLIISNGNRVVALFPANERDNKIFSHQGLTYGGMLFLPETTLTDSIEILKGIIAYYKKNGIESIIYKSIPYFYHKMPSSEDLYALHLVNASLIRRNASAVIDLRNKISYAKGRKSQISKANKYNLSIVQSENYSEFMRLVQERLKEKYDTNATHSLEEIIYLSSRFPGNIKLFTCRDQNALHAGLITYETETAVHCQYIGTSAFGREIGALDLLTDYLINKEYCNKQYFDFGTSADFSELGINIGLHKNKESYGARTVMCDIYEIKVN